jgi:hypothetical protein
MTSSSPRCEDRSVVTTVGLSNIPDTVRGLAVLTKPDYVDAFTAATGELTEGSAEAWARAVMEESPAARSAPLLWRLLGLRLGPTPSPDHVAGWRIAARGDEWITVETGSWLMTANGVVRVGDGHVSLALFIRYDRQIAAVIWPPVAVLHRRGAPVMVHQAVKALAPRPL